MKTLYKTIQTSGGRLTKIKKAIIDTLYQNKCLLSKQDLVEKLKDINLSPNRSTIFRELQYLSKSKVIVRNTIAGIEYYEIPKDHHHHLVCLGCSAINKVKFGNHLEKHEEKIAKEHKFNILSHSLEFYGYCCKCQS